MSALAIAEPRHVLRSSSVIRLTFGIAGLLAPERTCAVCGIDAADVSRETAYLMRLLAARDLLLALEHIAASRGTDEEAHDALRGAAFTGIADAAATLCELSRRRSFRGGMRAGLTFLVTDGIGFPVLWRLAERRRRSGA